MDGSLTHENENGQGKEPQKETSSGKTSQSKALSEQHPTASTNQVKPAQHPKRTAANVPSLSL